MILINKTKNGQIFQCDSCNVRGLEGEQGLLDWE